MAWNWNQSYCTTAYRSFWWFHCSETLLKHFCSDGTSLNHLRSTADPPRKYLWTTSEALQKHYLVVLEPPDDWLLWFISLIAFADLRRFWIIRIGFESPIWSLCIIISVDYLCIIKSVAFGSLAGASWGIRRTPFKPSASPLQIIKSTAAAIIRSTALDYECFESGCYETRLRHLWTTFEISVKELQGRINSPKWNMENNWCGVGIWLPCTYLGWVSDRPHWIVLLLLLLR